MNLGAPEFLLYLLVPFALYFLIAKGNRAQDSMRKSFFDKEAQAVFFGSVKKRGVLLTCCAFIFFGLSLIRPQYGYQEIIENRVGQDIAFVVDVSQSMLAKDLSPNRLGRVRFAITDFLSHLKGDRVGLVSFAGVSFIESPLTYDYSTFRLFLDDLSPDLIPVPGTNIESALKKVIQLYGGKERKFIAGRSKSVILFSDGEELSGNLASIITELKELGIRVYTVGLGSEIGAPIPTERGYKRDKTGKVVLTKLDRKSLEKLAADTGGAYLGGELTGVELESFFKEKISSGKEKSKIDGGVIRVWQEYYQVTLLVGLIFYFFSVIGQRSALALVLFLFLIPPSASRADALEEASKSYTQGNFRKALELYESAKNGENPSLAALGIAKSLYKLQRFSESKRSYLTLLEANRTPELLYNLGNTQTQAGEYKEAIESYQEALSQSPNDQEIKENLEYVKKLLQEESNSSSSSSSSSDNSSNDSSTSKQSGGGGGGQSSNDGSQSSEQSVKSSGQGSNSSSSSASNGGENNSSNSENSSNASSSSKGAGAGSSQQSSDGKQGQNSEGQNSEGQGSSQSVTEKDTRAKPSDREEMLYDTVQEDRGALRKYRQEKAFEELEQRQESPPEKDW